LMFIFVVFLTILVFAIIGSVYISREPVLLKEYLGIGLNQWISVLLLVGFILYILAYLSYLFSREPQSPWWGVLVVLLVFLANYFVVLASLISDRDTINVFKEDSKKPQE
jgi:hypothetical protein